MRIRDWSSDVCSSDLVKARLAATRASLGATVDDALRHRFVKGVEVEVAILLAALDIGLVADDEDIDFADHERQHRVDPREFAFECRRARLREIAAMIGEFQRQDRLVAAVMRFENRPDRAMRRGASGELRSERTRLNSS